MENLTHAEMGMIAGGFSGGAATSITNPTLNNQNHIIILTGNDNEE